MPVRIRVLASEVFHSIYYSSIQQWWNISRYFAHPVLSLLLLAITPYCWILLVFLGHYDSPKSHYDCWPLLSLLTKLSTLVVIIPHGPPSHYNCWPLLLLCPWFTSTYQTRHRSHCRACRCTTTLGGSANSCCDRWAVMGESPRIHILD